MLTKMNDNAVIITKEIPVKITCENGFTNKDE